MHRIGIALCLFSVTIFQIHHIAFADARKLKQVVPHHINVKSKSDASQGQAPSIKDQYAFGEKFVDAVVGDVNNDGKNEAVVFSKLPNSEPSAEEGDITFALSIYQIDPQGLELLWTDNGSLGYGRYSTHLSGEDALSGIGPLNGAGLNYLFIFPIISDVSCPIDILLWKNKGLVKIEDRKQFGSFDGTLAVHGDVFGITPIEYQGEKMFKAQLYGVVKSSETLPDGIHHRYVTGSKEVYGTIEDGVFWISDIP